MLSVLKKELAGAQNRMKQAADKRKSDRTFEIGDKVFLKVRRSLQQPFTSTPASKLNPKYFGPYVIEARVRKIPYKLRLHEGINMHPVFRVSLLKKSIKPRGTTSQQLPTAEDELEETLESRAILDESDLSRSSLPNTSSSLMVTTTTKPYYMEVSTQNANKVPTSGRPTVKYSWGQEYN